MKSLFFDQLPGAAAIVDASGIIRAVNATWRAMPPFSGRNDVGADYAAACRSAAACDETDAAEVVVGLRGVLDGSRREFRTVYARPSEGRVHWYEVRIWRLDDDGFRGAAIAHEDVTSLHEAERRAWALANVDPLTGIANRRVLQEAIERARLAGGDGDAGGIFAILDLDGFKGINDLYGHDVGDKVLVVVARRLRHGVRSGDTVARIGGDEFALLLCGVPQPADRLEAIVAAVRAPIRVAGTVLHLDASYGFVEVTQGRTSMRDLYHAADQAMYEMKRSHGRGQCSTGPASG